MELPSDRTCFDLMTQYSLTLTLFPYTTLFRSPRLKAARARAADRDFVSENVVFSESADGNVLRYEVTIRDRKSTRLNSSHQIISYAVFCLKKKSIENFHGTPVG